MPVGVRRYRAPDREAVRQICCETADRGEPVERFFADREAFADLVTSYYTDGEPEATWVAEEGGRVVGYLTGCLDTVRYRRVMLRRVVSRTFAKAVVRGLLWSGQAWRCGWAAGRTCLLGGFRRRIPLDQYPAHFHINIQQTFRGQHLGYQLVERFADQAKTAGLSGIHLGVSADNVASCRFFERMGFALLSRHPVVRPEGPWGRLTETHVYVKRL